MIRPATPALWDLPGCKGAGGLWVGWARVRPSWQQPASGARVGHAERGRCLQLFPAQIRVNNTAGLPLSAQNGPGCWLGIAAASVALLGGVLYLSIKSQVEELDQSAISILPTGRQPGGGRSCPNFTKDHRPCNHHARFCLPCQHRHVLCGARQVDTCNQHRHSSSGCVSGAGVPEKKPPAHAGTHNCKCELHSPATPACWQPRSVPWRTPLLTCFPCRHSPVVAALARQPGMLRGRSDPGCGWAQHNHGWGGSHSHTKVQG